MAATITWYGRGILHALTDTRWTADPVSVLLTTSAYVPDQDAHEFRSSVTAEVATGNGYVQGGTALANRSISYDAATNQVRLLADPASWLVPADGTLTARRAVIFKDTGSPATSPLLGWVDFGADQSVTDNVLAVAFDKVGGVLRITAS
jgi:hypothetical protein